MNTMMFQEMPTCARSEVAELPLNWFSSPPSFPLNGITNKTPLGPSFLFLPAAKWARRKREKGTTKVKHR